MGSSKANEMLVSIDDMYKKGERLNWCKEEKGGELMTFCFHVLL
jgi:hypothetical protein